METIKKFLQIRICVCEFLVVTVLTCACDFLGAVILVYFHVHKQLWNGHTTTSEKGGRPNSRRLDPCQDYPQDLIYYQ